MSVSTSPLLIRATNVGYQWAMVRLDGLVFEVIASDGRPLPAPIITTESLIAPGGRYDILLTMPASGQYRASVDYDNIRYNRTLGSASTTVTVV